MSIQAMILISPSQQHLLRLGADKLRVRMAGIAIAGPPWWSKDVLGLGIRSTHLPACRVSNVPWRAHMGGAHVDENPGIA